MSGHKIIEGLKEAVAGNFSRVTIEGQTWVRQDNPPEHAALQRLAAILASDARHTKDDSMRVTLIYFAGAILRAVRMEDALE